MKEIEHLKHCTQSNQDKIHNLQEYTKEIEEKLHLNINKNVQDRSDLRNLIDSVKNLDKNIQRIVDKQQSDIDDLKTNMNELHTRLSTNDVKTNKLDAFLDKLTWQMVLALGFVAYLIIMGTVGG